MENNIFFSWSGSVSNAIATVFNIYLPKLLQQSDIFYSKEGIPKDQAWFQIINTAINDVKTGIVFLTKDNIKKEWILFEAGAIAAKGSICILLHDLTVDYLKEQRSIFQYYNATTLNNEADLLRMLGTIREKISPKVTQETLNETFNHYKTEFQKDLTLYIENAEKKNSASSAFETIQGVYVLNIIDRESKHYREELRIDSSGKYYLIQDGKEVYYFHLKLLKIEDNVATWQKLYVSDGIPSDSVHSTETVRLNSNNNMTGEDTFGYVLAYRKTN